MTREISASHSHHIVRCVAKQQPRCKFFTFIVKRRWRGTPLLYLLEVSGSRADAEFAAKVWRSQGRIGHIPGNEAARKDVFLADTRKHFQKIVVGPKVSGCCAARIEAAALQAVTSMLVDFTMSLCLAAKSLTNPRQIVQSLSATLARSLTAFLILTWRDLGCLLHEQARD